MTEAKTRTRGEDEGKMQMAENSGTCNKVEDVVDNNKQDEGASLSHDIESFQRVVKLLSVDSQQLTDDAQILTHITSGKTGSAVRG